jgi:hypothetical protein
MEMSQETRRRQNEFLAARGSVVPPVGTELNPVPYVNYVMPPLDDDMFAGVDDFGDFEPPPPLSQKMLLEMKVIMETKKIAKALLSSVMIFER